MKVKRESISAHVKCFRFFNEINEKKFFYFSREKKLKLIP